MLRMVLIMGCLCLLVSCHGDVSGERVLFDFESDSELDRLHWRCHTLFSLSDRHATHGDKSLRLELFPSDYPGLAPMLDVIDWRAYKALCFDIYNPGEKEVRITIRMDDRKEYPDYEDRYNERFILKPGMNGVRIPLDTLVTSGTGRKLNTGNIYRVFIFMVRPEKVAVLYVDHMRLAS